MQVFNNADIIVGLHGAAFANLCFCKPSTKIIELKSKINDFEIIITESEQEALLLENSLIKKNKPFYNVRLKDDKSYPYIKVNLKENVERQF